MSKELIASGSWRHKDLWIYAEVQVYRVTSGKFRARLSGVWGEKETLLSSARFDDPFAALSDLRLQVPGSDVENTVGGHACRVALIQAEDSLDERDCPE